MECGKGRDRMNQCTTIQRAAWPLLGVLVALLAWSLLPSPAHAQHKQNKLQEYRGAIASDRADTTEEPTVALLALESFPWGAWFWQNGIALLSAVLPSVTVAGGTLLRARRRRKALLQQAEERRQQQMDRLIADLASKERETQTMAAVALRNWVETERDQVAFHAFHLAVASLRLIPTGSSVAQEAQALRQELIEVMRTAFPLVRAGSHDLLELDATNLSLQGAYLARADLHHIVLHQSILVGADLRAADLRYADVSQSDLRTARMEGANCSQAQLEEANLAHAQLQGVRFRRARLRNATLVHANLVGADLHQADLRGADLRYCVLQDQGVAAILSRTQLAGADLRGVDLRGVDIRGADLRGAKLQGADFSQAIQDRPVLSFGRASLMTLLTRCLRDLTVLLTKRVTDKR